MGRIDLKNTSRPKKEYKNINRCSEYDLPVRMSHVLIIERNSVKLVEMKSACGSKLEEVTPTVRGQDSLKHAVNS